MGHGGAATHFTEDGGEFNQIESNLAMICATVARGSSAFLRTLWGAFATQVGAIDGARAGAIGDVQLGKRAAGEKIGAAS
jgi:hypothetical protein